MPAVPAPPEVGFEPVVYPLLTLPRDPRHDRPVFVVLAGEVKHPAGVLQQHPHRDPPVQPELGQVVYRRFVQPDPALGNQLQHHGRREGLDVAADPEVPVCRRLRLLAQPAHPGAADPLAELIFLSKRFHLKR